jgi:signal transduction histidine kinase
MEIESPRSSTEDALCDALAEIERLRADIRERDELLAVASHELRNPLHVLTLQIAAARLAAQARQQTEITARLEKAERLLSRYAERLGVLLDLSRLNAKAYPLAVREVDLGRTLRQLVEALRPEADYHRVDLQFEGPQQCLVQTDPLALEQVIGNLLVNAFKHSGCRHATLTLETTDRDAVMLHVADDGRGIAEPEQRRIFDKFTVGRAGTNGSGSGLGLWIVRKLAEALGANISLDSRPAAGCRFTLRLPRRHVGHALEHPSNAAPS